MKQKFARAFIGLVATVNVQDVTGWWSADPVHAGESSHIALQIRDKDGKPEARLWLMDIGAYDIGLGEVAIHGDALDTKGLSFPLKWNADKQTLSGTVPVEAAPIYNIPIEFKRGAPVAKPAPNEWKAPRPQVTWSVETGSPVWAGLELAKDGSLFVGNEAGALRAITRKGEVRWKFETGKPIRSQPKWHGGFVYLHSDSGYLYKLDAKSGKELWRAKVDTGSGPRLPPADPATRWDRYGSGMALDSTHIYVASRDKNLYALDTRSGREIWRVAAGDIMTATPARYRDLVIFADYAGKVRAVTARDGTARWSFDAKLAVPGDLVVSGDRVLVGSRTYDLIALSAATGQEQWRRYYWFSWIESPPVVRGGVVYTGSSDATAVYARNVADGSLRWKTPVPGWAWQRVAIDGKTLIAGTVGTGAFPASRNGALVALDRESGAMRWIFLDPPSAETVAAKQNWGFAASPVIADGVVYAADLGGNVYALLP
jgi:outer membrane protein assembly factor BamB